MDYNITTRKKDKGWQYIISYKNEYGNWKQKSKQGFELEREAKKAANKRVDELRDLLAQSSNILPEYEGITFKEFADMLLDQERLTKEYNSIASTNTALMHFETLFNEPINDIKHMDIQQCVNEMIKKGLKLSSVKLYLTKIKYIFTPAADPYAIIAASPIGKIKLPAMDSFAAISTTKNNALTQSELSEVFAFLKDKRPMLYYLCSFATASGLREGELLGLTWKDIDFKNKTVSVNKQWKLTAEGTYDFGRLKKRNSYRTVPLSGNACKNLMEHRDSQLVLPFDNRVFNYKNNTSLTTGLARYSEISGIRFSLHTFRHTYATNLIANGMDFKTAAYLLGHDVEMTMKVYSHVTDDMKEEAAKLIDNIF